MSELDDALRDVVRASSHAILHDQDVLATTAKVMGQERAMQISAQMSTAEDLRKLREQYEADLKEQTEENRKNRKLAIWSFGISIVATIFGGCSLFVAVIALVLQLSK